MRVYIINADDLIVSREAPAEPGENEIVVASVDELRAARNSSSEATKISFSPGSVGVSRLTIRSSTVMM